MKQIISLSVPSMIGREKEYVNNAIDLEWVSTGGTYVNSFENAIAEYVGIPFSVACQSGTSGLHLALLASGVRQGQEVIVPALTFVAAVNPV